MGQLFSFCQPSQPNESAYPGQQPQQQPSRPPQSAPRNNGPAVSSHSQAPAASNSRPAPAFGGARSFPPSSSAGDGKRAQASQHAQARGRLMQQSQEAWNRGDKAKAKELSEQGKAEGKKMEKCNAEAADLYFKDNNKDKGMDTIDLHGLYVEEAVIRMEARLRSCKAAKLPQLVVIVGRGNHSTNGVKIRPAIEKMMREHKLKVAVDSPNAGCLTVYFDSGEGFLEPPGGSGGSCINQ